jgi:hypothetical protein
MGDCRLEFGGDRSVSLQGSLQLSQRALRGFARGLPPEDFVSCNSCR